MNNLIGGLDEVGMGCLAGPLVICVAVFPEEEPRPPGVVDSKKTSVAGRRRVLPIIVEKAEFLNFGYASESDIDRYGLSSAWQQAAKMALEGVPDIKHLVVDGDRAVLAFRGRQVVQPKADISHWQVSAASIIAKILRDDHMSSLSKFYPQYQWDQNSGYGTQAHRQALLEKGPCPIHRAKFIRKIIG